MPPITSNESEAFAAKFTGWTQQLTDRERVMLGTAINAGRDEPGGALPTAAVPTVGPVIAAVLAAVEAVTVILGQLEAKALEDEADVKDREAGMNDGNGQHLGHQPPDRIQNTRRGRDLGLPDDG